MWHWLGIVKNKKIRRCGIFHSVWTSVFFLHADICTVQKSKKQISAPPKFTLFFIMHLMLFIIEIVYTQNSTYVLFFGKLRESVIFFENSTFYSNFYEFWPVFFPRLPFHICGKTLKKFSTCGKGGNFSIFKLPN